LPAGLTLGGLPVGIEFDGPVGTDRTVLALGVAVERLLGPLPNPRGQGD
jgi:indoleacetamide hydrolase